MSFKCYTNKLLKWPVSDMITATISRLRQRQTLICREFFGSEQEWKLGASFAMVDLWNVYALSYFSSHIYFCFLVAAFISISFMTAVNTVICLHVILYALELRVFFSICIKVY